MPPNLPAQKDLFAPPSEEDPAFLQEQIITYLGNKRSLLPFIEEGILLVKKRLNQEKISTLDLFSGTGIVARMLKKHAHHIITNDLETYSKITNSCYLSNKSKIPLSEIEYYRQKLTQSLEPDALQAGFITELYAPRDDENIQAHERVFFTHRNATYLDTACQAIQKLPKKFHHFFLAPLLSEASIHANTSGVFKGFYKNSDGIGQFGGTGKNALSRILSPIELKLPVLSQFSCTSKIYQEDANALIRKLPELDLAYLDPPYNQHPYGSNYFLLNIISDYKRPENISPVSGITKDWNRSAYNKKQAAKVALFSLIENCPAKFILISYSSEGFIHYDEFIEQLKLWGNVTTLETPYNAFRGSRNLKTRPLHLTEFLFLLEKK